MMMKRFAAVAALASLVMFAASMVAAQEKEVKVTVVAGEDASGTCAHGMKLTDEQRTKVEDLRAEQRLRAIELRADLQKLGVELKRETGKAEPDMKAVEAILKKMSAARERLQMSRIEHGVAMKKLLGDDWRGHMSLGRGGEETMRVEVEAGEDCEHDVRVLRFRDRDGVREGRMPGPDGRRFRMKAVPPAKMSACVPGHPVMMKHRKGSAPKAGCSGHDACGGKAVRARSSRKDCSGSCAAHKSVWESRMFRPRGKKTEHRCACGERHVEWRHEMPAEGRRTRSFGGR